MARDHKLLLPLFLVVALIGTPARADSAGEARVRYERAIKLYEEGVYDAALVELTRAYELHPSFKVLYNIGQVRVALLDYAGAVEAFQRYLREGGGKIPEQRVEAVRKELATLSQRVAQLTIASDVQGAEVLIDDLLVGVTPLRTPVLVNSGMRRVTLRHPERAPETQRVSVAGGEQLTVGLLLTPQRAAEPAQLASPAPLPPASEPQVAAPPSPAAVAAASETSGSATEAKRPALDYVVFGSTGALALASGSLAIGALVLNRKLDERRDDPGEAPNAFEDDRLRMRRMALAADVLAISALAGAAVSTWLLLQKDRRPSPANSRAPARTTHVELGPSALRVSSSF